MIKLPKIIRKEVDDSHFYFVDDNFSPGVTSILDEAAPVAYSLKQFMLNNSAEAAEDIKNTTGAFGTKMHKAYEALIEGVKLDLKNGYPNKKEKMHLASFKQWFIDYKPTKLLSEQVVASKTFNYAGTLDLACEINGELWIVDFKTGSGIYFSHELQLAAYKQAYEEMFGVKVLHIGVLRTGTKHKSGYEFKELFRGFPAFLNVYNTYLELHDGVIPQPPLVNVYPDVLSLEFDARPTEPTKRSSKSKPGQPRVSFKSNH